MQSTNNSTTIRCPYIPEHVMHIDSLLTHLNRCKANNKYLFKSCLYNSLHVILKQKYQEHVQNCVDGAKFREENDQMSWEERQKRRKAICFVTKKVNKSDSDSSNHSCGQILENNNELDSSGNYSYDNHHYSEQGLRNRSCLQQHVQYQVQHHSVLDLKDKEYMNKKQGKLNKKLNLNLTEDCSKQKINDKNIQNIFKKPVLTVSEQDTLEDTQSISKTKSLKNEDEDADILIILNQIDRKDKILNIEDNCDELGNKLIEQVKMMEKVRCQSQMNGNNRLQGLC